jgi:hypothetical protein
VGPFTDNAYSTALPSWRDSCQGMSPDWLPALPSAVTSGRSNTKKPGWCSFPAREAWLNQPLERAAAARQLLSRQHQRTTWNSVRFASPGGAGGASGFV